MNSQRVKGFNFGVNLATAAPAGENPEPQPPESKRKGSKCKTTISTTLTKKFKNQLDRDSGKKDSTDGASNHAGYSLEVAMAGAYSVGSLDQQRLGASLARSGFNPSLMKAVNKFKKQSSTVKRKTKADVKDGDLPRFRAVVDKNGNDKMHRQTIVGRLIIEKNTKILILLVLLMMLSSIVFNSSLYQSDPDSCSSDVVMIQGFIKNIGISSLATNAQYISLVEYTLSCKFPDMTLIDYDIPGYGALVRTQEYWDSVVVNCTASYTKLDGSEGTLHVSFQTPKYSNISHVLNIAKMIFLMIVLFLGSYMFTIDANRLILLPIENILCLVNLIAKSPDLSEQLLTMQKNHKVVKFNEFKAVESAILKLGKLLVLVFGRAGNNVIYHNISNIASEEIDLEKIGTNNIAIFGFCNIKHFQDLNEILQEDIMPFVNNVSNLVHNSVVKFMGSANKNIGDCFLIVWNLPEECFAAEDGGQEEGQLLNSNIFLERYAESALASFVNIIIKLAHNNDVQKFAETPQVQKELPNLKVKMGFGLHMGWAIEGAIGSGIKIDTSYLSPNVNIASRLEAASKKYSVPLLMSHHLHEVLSQKTKNFCRQVDCVTLKGSEEPVGLFTIDVDPYRNVDKRNSSVMNLRIPLQHPSASFRLQSVVDSPTDIKEKYLQEDFNFNIETLVPEFLVYYVKEDQFKSSFDKAVQSYLAGKWHQARELLEACLILQPKDGPSRNLLELITAAKNTPPSNWRGVRQLVDK